MEGLGGLKVLREGPQGLCPQWVPGHAPGPRTPRLALCLRARDHGPVVGNWTRPLPRGPGSRGPGARKMPDPGHCAVPGPWTFIPVRQGPTRRALSILRRGANTCPGFRQLLPFDGLNTRLWPVVLCARLLSNVSHGRSSRLLHQCSPESPIEFRHAPICGDAWWAGVGLDRCRRSCGAQSPAIAYAHWRGIAMTSVPLSFPLMGRW